LLLQVFRHIKTIYPDAQLLKVGGAGRPYWRKQTLQIVDQLGLVAGKDVVFSGRIDDEMLVDMYCAADVFVSTSLYEGFGLPALEAMAVGTPVVVTNRGSFPEVVGQNGWVVEPEEKLFVQAVQEALHDPLHAELSRRGRARAATFTWAKAAEQYLDIMYRESRCIA
jgi:glycosyltransferase involved in cell wall biosynthesis